MEIGNEESETRNEVKVDHRFSHQGLHPLAP